MEGTAQFSLEKSCSRYEIAFPAPVLLQSHRLWTLPNAVFSLMVFHPPVLVLLLKEKNGSNWTHVLGFTDLTPCSLLTVLLQQLDAPGFSECLQTLISPPTFV